MGLNQDGSASAHVELGPGLFARRSGPDGTSLADALAWAREVADRVLVTTADALWSAGAAPVGSLPPWPDAAPPGDWPAVAPARAEGWRAALGLGLELDDPPFLEAVAARLGGRVSAGPRAEVVFPVAGGPLDVCRRDAEAAVDAAWEATAARLGRAPEVAVSGLDLEPVGAVTGPQPAVALLEPLEPLEDGTGRWAVLLHGEEYERPDAPYGATFAACLAYGQAHADVVLARRRWAEPYVDPARL